jgi:hypothetical protein
MVGNNKRLLQAHQDSSSMPPRQVLLNYVHPDAQGDAFFSVYLQQHI